MLRNLVNKLKVKVTRIKQRKKEKERITYERERISKYTKKLKVFFFLVISSLFYQSLAVH